MLEIPESNTIARQLRESVVGKKIIGAEAGHTPHGFAFYTGDAAAYGRLLTGRRVEDAAAHGGFVEMRAEDRQVLLFDGANIRLYMSGEKRPDRHQLLIDLEGGASIVCTVSMYAGLHAVPLGGMDDNPYLRAAQDKPSPLDDAFDENYFEGIVRAAKPTLSAKGLLATQQRIPGLGNGVLQDILFQAHVHPKRKVRDLCDGDLDRLYHSVRNTLRAMTDGGGRDTERDLLGNQGGYRTLLCKNTLQNPCPTCGGTVSKQTYMGGAVYFCPDCQALPD